MHAIAPPVCGSTAPVIALVLVHYLLVQVPVPVQACHVRANRKSKKKATRRGRFPSIKTMKIDAQRREIAVVTVPFLSGPLEAHRRLYPPRRVSSLCAVLQPMEAA